MVTDANGASIRYEKGWPGFSNTLIWHFVKISYAKSINQHNLGRLKFWHGLSENLGTQEVAVWVFDKWGNVWRHMRINLLLSASWQTKCSSCGHETCCRFWRRSKKGRRRWWSLMATQFYCLASKIYCTFEFVTFQECSSVVWVFHHSYYSYFLCLHLDGS